MLRLHDPRTGRAEPLPAGPGLRVQVVDGPGLRVPVVADLLRRVAQRSGRRVRVVSTSPLPEGHDWQDYNIAPFEVLDEPIPNADVIVSGTGHDGDDVLTLTVPPETGAWGRADPPAVRLAMLQVPYREPLELTAEAVARAAERLDRWRAAVAEWATSPSRPMSREHVAEAEAALADDLNVPAALSVLDRLVSDAAVPPGAKMETFIHLDLLLAVEVVSAIGSA
ncbi:MAG TPA: hypothetical protein VIL71_09060 [Spirillospora sp.]